MSEPHIPRNPVAPGREAEEATGIDSEEATGSGVFSPIEEAIEEIRRGRMVVVCDDENRENEGDLTMAAQFATPEAINFMAKHGRGLICLSLTARALRRARARPDGGQERVARSTPRSRSRSRPATG